MLHLAVGLVDECGNALLLCPGAAVQLHMLLHLEELQQEVDVRTYDMTGVSMEPSPSRTLLWLEVPGLAEARPSVLRGDLLYVARADGALGNKEWQGYVHMVERDKVCCAA